MVLGVSIFKHFRVYRMASDFALCLYLMDLHHILDSGSAIHLAFVEHYFMVQ